ncbi:MULTISPECIES: antibiotic biosynthesis monooxygenase family protein [unclassified Streptomyces]|uniref:antibiotic biosynthesis monooxygenase family protein n=1 Tax=unclassified Streptomyces TaxID=2593676 RepID=UPI0036FCCF19
MSVAPAGEVRVLVYHATTDEQGVEAAYHRVSLEMAKVDGMLGNELLHSLPDPQGFLVLSRWRDEEAFHAWERGASHQDSTSPLRPFRDTRMSVPFGIYRVRAAY